MKTYPLKDKNGFQIGFEIENVYISLRKIVKLLSTIKEVSDIKPRRLFDFRNENHIEFDYTGNDFVVMEPFGDNSRYWIGPKGEPDTKVDVSDIENVFIQYSPSIFIEFLGDLISLNLKKLLKIGK
jgi:hypothetical protein